ncbi:hypothetical protein [Streptomyces sp. NPDC005438]|uniref:hypothetical protein n=1 Tax=Streptomyces sp. NPDC005438 TaxID=3156880 RepID=UPI0033A1A229
MYRSRGTDRERRGGRAQAAFGQVLLGLVIVAGLVGAVVLGMPALDSQRTQPGDAPAAAEGP